MRERILTAPNGAQGSNWARAHSRVGAAFVTALVLTGCASGSSTPGAGTAAGYSDRKPGGALDSPNGQADAPHAAMRHDGRHAPHGRTHSHTFTNADEWANVFDDPERDAWQRPTEVLRALDLEPTMSVADVGAGTGYFAVRLARAVPRGEVIATDIEPDMVRFLSERARREGLGNVRAVHSTESASGLLPASVERILLVNVWHHLEQRAAYARDLAAALKSGGRLLIVEFGVTARRGPPQEMRVAPEAVISTLVEAGLVANVSPVSLPEQYIVEARKPQ